MLYDARIRSYVIQCGLIGIVVLIGAVLVSSTSANLRAKGIPIGFDFLFQPAGFSISETVLPYKSTDPNWWAAVVGIANSLFVSSIVLVASSILGLLIGIGRLSSNPMASGACRVWVEIARNTPALILLIFTYSIWWRILPQVQDAWTLAPGVHLSLRGLVLPRVSFGTSSAPFLFLPLVAAALLCARYAARRQQMATGKRPPYILMTSIALTGLTLGALIINRSSISVDWPRMGRANFTGGMELTPELTTILLGLTVYTAGFIAEIVRGGILSVGQGQWEAARAVGLSRKQILRLVVVPQALRVILPPLTSQYINAVKNSTLAIAVGFQDFLTIMQTIINKSSHAVEGIFLILGVFLLLNLCLSALLNAFNRRVAIVER
jgi:general L-amino acid transport system permease protein